MSTTAVTRTASTPAMPAGSPLRRLAWHWRHNPKRELWFAWWTTVAFYQVFAVVFFPVTHTQPPPNPWSDAPGIVQWFNDNHYGVLIGFGVMFVITGMTAPTNALIAYSMRRMSVSRAFGYSYLVLYSLSAIPGMLLMCLVLTVGVLRPDRDPKLLSWLYDFAFLSFVGTMGVFLIGSVVWMVAILLDKNRVFPKWFGYLNLCNALTEIVVSPAWIFRRGVFAWNGTIAWWINMVVFGIYTTSFIVLLRKMIEREDFGTGPLPDAPRPIASALKKTAGEHVPGQPDMWIFALFEALVFTSYFVVYMIFRTRNPELYLQSQAKLDMGVGVLETLLMLTSSWSLAQAVHSSRHGAYRSALTNVFITMAFGVAFVCSKLFEWHEAITHGYEFTTNEFFSHYFFLTGIHFLHLLIGFVALGVIAYQLWSPARRSQQLIETGATYWHTVDFLWVIIFAMLYAVR